MPTSGPFLRCTTGSRSRCRPRAGRTEAASGPREPLGRAAAPRGRGGGAGRRPRSLLEERVEGGACALPIVLGAAHARRVARGLAEHEELAEIRLLLVRAPLGLRLAALVVDRGIEEAAVQAALEVGQAVRAGVGPLQLGQEMDLVATAVAKLHAPDSTPFRSDGKRARASST